MFEDGRQIDEREANKLDTANKAVAICFEFADEATEGFFDEVLGMWEAFGGNAKQSNPLISTTKGGLPPQQSGANTFQPRSNRYG